MAKKSRLAKLKEFDPVDYLKTDEEIRLYLEACIEERDPELLAAALGDVARARNMTALAKKVGLTRAGLYKALSPAGNPSFVTVARVIDALGLRLRIESAK